MMTDLRDLIARAIYESEGYPHPSPYLNQADAVLAVLADHDAKVRAAVLREAAAAFEGGAINVEVFGGGPEVVYWRTVNETRGNIVSSLRARADRIERGEQDD